MAKTVTINLGGADYVLPMLNLDQQSRAMAIDAAAPDALHAILKIGLERATPKVSTPDLIEATAEEICAAAEKLLAFSGLGLPELSRPPPHAFR